MKEIEMSEMCKRCPNRFVQIDFTRKCYMCGEPKAQHKARIKSLNSKVEENNKNIDTLKKKYE